MSKPNRPAAEITVDEWAAELHRLATERSGDGGVSVQDLVDGTCHGIAWVRRHLGILHRAGRLVVGARWSETIDGRPCKTPVYRLREPPC